MSTITLSIAVLVGLLVRLAMMREVRAAHIILGRKLIDTSPDPPYIADIYHHAPNTPVCNAYFYSRLVIQATFWLCVTVTALALTVAFLSEGMGLSPQPTTGAPRTSSSIHEGSLDQVAWPALAFSPDGQTAGAVTIESSERYVAIVSDRGIQSLTAINPIGMSLLVVADDGSISRVDSVPRIIQLLLFVGVMAALLCWLIAGKIKAMEDATADGGEDAPPAARDAAPKRQ